MRMLMNVIYPLNEFNESVRDGTVGQKMEAIFEEIKPEAVYFTEQRGSRSVILIVEVENPSRVPSLAEPFFLLFNASVEFRIVMDPGELARAGLDALGKKWG